jgi:hypoxanthine phosphoribosyltransferase
MIKIKDKEFVPYIKHDEIIEKVRELARIIDADYKDKRPMLICVLNGAFMFASDLMKELSVVCEITFIKLSSYKGMSSTGVINIEYDLTHIAGRNVIVVEDIIDTGTTLNFLMDHLKKSNPESLRICTLLLKSEATKHHVQAHYVGFEIDNKFVVGYGLDYDEAGRNLNDIYQLKL